MTRLRIPGLIATLLFATAFCVACGSGGQDAASADPQGGSLTQPAGWYKIALQANSAKTLMDNAGHFTTDRNACGRSAAGALSLDTWNRLAQSVNRAAAELVKPSALREPGCVTIENPGKMDGTAELFLDGSKKILLQMRGYDACTSIPDPALAREVYKAIELLVLAADKEDCPYGWGSG